MTRLRHLTVEAAGLVMFSVLLGGAIFAIYMLGRRGDEEVLNEAARLEATLLFNKPFEIEDFLTVVAFLT